MLTKHVEESEKEVLEKEFWTNELEYDITRAEHAVRQDKVLQQWIDARSGRQVRMLCHLFGLNHEGSIPKLRPAIHEQEAELTAFYCVEQFGKGKSEIAVVEVAREVLSPHVVDLCICPKRAHDKSVEMDAPTEERYDKNALMFALFRDNPRLLKEVFHFDKVHKKGFASMVLAESRRKPPSATFAEFLTDRNVRVVIESYQHTCHDGSVSELQGISKRDGRFYIFIRRTEKPDHIHDGRRGIVHGYRTEWIVLDFSPDGDQVNVASNSVNEPLEIANRIARAYFGRECRFINEQKFTPQTTIVKFIESVRAGRDGAALVEVCVNNSPLRGASKVRITSEDAGALRESLDHFDDAIGTAIENIADVECIKVLYCGKHVGLQFEPDERDEGQYVVRYTDQRLNAFERRRFEQQMREKHGISILSTEKR